MDAEHEKNHKVTVAQYLRMSTDHQQYSIHNQAEFIKNYAEKNNMEIVHTYNDAGKSGVTIEGRHALKQLLSDVINTKIDIKAILFYDVSRFGRFQEMDEAAYYSYLFNMHGVELIFCAEPIPTKDFPLESSVILNIKRASAAYHSKNLSEKVFIGQVNLIMRGYHQGGMPGYGLRRLLINENGQPKEILYFQQRKSIQTDRVILIPGPQKEIRIVNEIYDFFNIACMPEFLIAEKLNNMSIPAENYSLWTRSKVHQILTNEKYIGNNVYNKTSGKLKSKSKKNPKEEWIRCEKAFKPIVSRKKFLLAQSIIQLRSAHLTDNELLEHLKNKLKEKGKLSGFIIDEDDFGPSSSVYRARFGGLLRAYTLINYKPKQDYNYIQQNEFIRNLYPHLINDFIELIKAKNCIVDKEIRAPLLYINNEILISLLLCKCEKRQSGKLRWKVKFEKVSNADITIVMRLDSTNTIPLDYYILPKLDILFTNLVLSEKNSIALELYRYDNLYTFLTIIERQNLRNTYAA